MEFLVLLFTANVIYLKKNQQSNYIKKSNRGQLIKTIMDILDETEKIRVLVDTKFDGMCVNGSLGLICRHDNKADLTTLLK